MTEKRKIWRTYWNQIPAVIHRPCQTQFMPLWIFHFGISPITNGEARFLSDAPSNLNEDSTLMKIPFDRSTFVRKQSSNSLDILDNKRGMQRIDHRHPYDVPRRSSLPYHRNRLWTSLSGHRFRRFPRRYNRPEWISIFDLLTTQCFLLAIEQRNRLRIRRKHLDCWYLSVSIQASPFDLESQSRLNYSNICCKWNHPKEYSSSDRSNQWSNVTLL